MQEETRRSAESRTGVVVFLAGLWLIAAPPVLDFGAARDVFRPYWIPMVLAVVLMLAGLLRALAPLDLPWLRPVTLALAVLLVAVPFVRDSDGSVVVLVNQVVVGAGLALGSLTVVVLTDD